MRRHRNSKGRFTKTSHKRKSSRRRKKNGAGLGKHHFRALMAAGKAKAKKARKAPKRKRSSKRARKSTTMRRIRPTVLVSKSGRYHRPRRSKYFTRPRRINRRRKNGFGSGIVSTIKRALSVNTVTNYLGIGGGLFVGTLLSKMLNTGMVPFTSSVALPNSITSTLSGKYVRPFHGLIHIIVGTLIASKMRNKYAKDVGIGLAALGGFDLLTQVLSLAGVANLPTFSGMNVNMLGRTSYSPGNTNGYSGMNVGLSGMNVNMLGDARGNDAESEQLADNINDMLS